MLVALELTCKGYTTGMEHFTACGYSKQVFNMLHPFLACSDGMNFFT